MSNWKCTMLGDYWWATNINFLLASLELQSLLLGEGFCSINTAWLQAFTTWLVHALSLQIYWTAPLGFGGLWPVLFSCSTPNIFYAHSNAHFCFLQRRFNVLNFGKSKSISSDETASWIWKGSSLRVNLLRVSFKSRLLYESHPC